MATWDNADLLARCRRDSAQEVPDDMDDTDWYAYLTEAQVHWHGLFSVHFPWLLYSAPTKLSTADGGLTYTFPNGVYPSKVEVYDTLGGRLMIPCAPWNTGGDYVWEGKQIRFPRNATRSFADGPYARYIVPPGVIDGGTQPILQPDWARVLLVARALILWAGRGGLRDTEPYEKRENNMWYGEPERGEVGILGILKTQNPFGGAASLSGRWVTGLDLLGRVGGYQ